MEDFDAERVGQPLPASPSKYANDPLVKSSLGFGLLGPLALPGLVTGIQGQAAAGALPQSLDSAGQSLQGYGQQFGSPLLGDLGGALRGPGPAQPQQPLPPGPWDLNLPPPTLPGQQYAAPWELPTSPASPPVQPQRIAPVMPGGARGGGTPAFDPMAEAGKLLKPQADANAKLADAEIANSNAQAQHKSDQAMAMFNAENQANAKRQAFEQAQAQQLAAWGKANDELANAAPDPNQLWNRLSGGQQLLAGLAVGLHGIGDAFMGTHTENPLDRAIRMNLDQQKAQIDSKRASLAGKLNLIKMYRDNGLDSLAAEKAAHLKMTELAGDYLDSVAQNASNGVIKAKAEAESARLLGQVPKLKIELQKATDEHAKTWAEINHIKAQTAQAGAKAAGMDPKLMVQLPDGRTFSAPTEKDAELIRNQIAQGKSFKATLDEIAKTSPGLADQFLNWIGYTTPTQAQFNGLAQSAVDKFRPATSGSTAEMGDPSQRALRSTLARAPGESGAAYADRLRRMGQQADVGLNSTLTAIGQAPIINATPRK